MDVILPLPTSGPISPIRCDNCYEGIYRTDNGNLQCELYSLPPVAANACPVRKQEWAEKLKKAGIEKRYINANLQNVEPKDERNHAKTVDYCENLKANIDNGTGVLLRGPVGNGKTTLGVAVMQAAMLAGYGALFVPTASLLDNIFTLKATNIEQWAVYEHKLRNSAVLMLDDLGTEYDKAESWVVNKLDSIISERYNRMLPNIITTNLADAQMKGRYAERIIDRMKQTSLVLTFTGKTLREAAIHHTPEGMGFLAGDR